MDLTNLKKQAEEQPLAVITLGILALTAASKTIDSITKARYARTWRKEVKRRTKSK